MQNTIELKAINDELLFDLSHLFVCRIKMLIVTDGSGGYSETSGFHLGQVLKVLAQDPWSHVKFEVTKAHRQNDSGADVIDNFRFDKHNLAQYDQVWLFGINRSGPDALDESELRALAEFMDNGGGIFATGDHENLGQAMCAEVPRIRSMRRWYHPNPGPNGEPVAPGISSPDNHDTVVAPGNQSDKTPQQIRPRWYQRFSPGPVVTKVTQYPHPILCGAQGVINYLPDHSHEGLCEEPADLSASYTFNGYTTNEYPSHGGHQEKPQVIAWAKNHVDHSEFGVLAAYDGHRVNVGRVVVDATWHHWFNINLNGFLVATDPANPAYDPTIEPKWAEIKAYFRNVALWLARKKMQNCLRNGGWLIAIKYYDILIAHRNVKLVKNLAGYYWQIGVFARDALGRLAPQCQHLRWSFEILEWLEISEAFPIDPWISHSRQKDMDNQSPQQHQPQYQQPWLDLDDIEAIALGGAIDALVTQYGSEKDLEDIFDRQQNEIETIAQCGAAEAIAVFLKNFQQAGRSVDNLIERGCRKM